MGEVTEKNLRSGGKVYLASWEDLVPPTHGLDLQTRSWNSSSSRDGMAFYESTIQFMRNDWATSRMPTCHAQLDGQDVMLFHCKETNTWHTTDALDIDHATPWKKHLENLGVDNVADAQMAYNDVANLRMLPSIYNRARDSADKVLEQHGPQSVQWKQWVEERFSFDSTIQYREFDPEKDGARRTYVTKDALWTEQNTRSELGFDKKVMDVWFEKELQKNHAGNVTIESPDKSQTWEVPLFRCAATGQLVTRDALDIDHAIPFEQLIKKMHELYPDGFSKANALDAYNDTSNLRLVGRSANSSHEWELMPDGHFRDKIEPELPNEFRGFIEDTGPMDKHTRSLLQEAIGDIRTGRQMMVERHWEQQSGQQGLPQPGMPPQGPLVSQPGHPDHPIYSAILGEIDRLDPRQEVLKGQQREGMASSLVVVAKYEGMPGMSRLSWMDDGGKPSLKMEFDGSGGREGRICWLGLAEGAQRTVQQNTQSLAQMALHGHQPSQSVTPPQQQDPTQTLGGQGRRF